jgi:hypothetical protein
MKHTFSAQYTYFLIYIVGIATGYGLDGRGSIHGKGKRLFSTLQHPTSSGGGGVKHEADSSPPSSAHIENGGANFHSLIRLNGVMLN